MSMYFFYQGKSDDSWTLALASERKNISASMAPELMTALDVDNTFEQDMTKAEILSVKYSGDFYLDWDGDQDERTELLDEVRKFCVKLIDMGVDMGMVRLYLSGNKGVHCEIPMGLFMPKVPPSGIPMLPAIYKEMAALMPTEFMDFRIYSAKKGRQWRCPNVQRSSGTYKVQVTWEEMQALTPEKYDELVSAPRPLFDATAPVLNAQLQLIYARARQKVDVGVAKMKKRKSTDDALAQFNGQWPQTVVLLMNNVGVRAGVGWNRVAIQLAIVADGLGKTEQQLIEDAAVLLKEYKGDGRRYDSTWARRRELVAQFRYMAGNPCYEYSPGGVLALMTNEVRANTDLTNGDWIPVEEEDKVFPSDPTPDAEDGESSEEEDKDPDAYKPGMMTKNLRLDRNGLFVRVEDAFKRVSDLGLTQPCRLMDQDGRVIGYHVQVWVGGRNVGEDFIPMSTMLTKQRMSEWATRYSTSIQANDNQIAAISDLFRERTEQSEKNMYLVTREGVDLVVPPGARSSEDYDIIWSAPSGVVSKSKNRYAFRGEATPAGHFQSDLMNAPMMENSEEMREYLTALFDINSKENVAKMLGWFVACFLNQIIRKSWGQFPSLQVFGQAGAGKSQTTKLFSHMHWFMHPLTAIDACGTSKWPCYVASSQSASLPVVFEEVKPRQMPKLVLDAVQGILRGNYTGEEIKRGGLSRDSGVTEKITEGYKNSAPLCFIGEALEEQSAILERCISVELSTSSRYGRYDAWSKVGEREEDRVKMASLGRLLLEQALDSKYLAVSKMVGHYRDEVLKKLNDTLPSGVEAPPRPVFNNAVVLTGLAFLRKSLQTVFGNTFDRQVEELMECIVSRVHNNAKIVMSEVSKVLDVMAQLTRCRDITYLIDQGVEYTVNQREGTVDLKLKPAYAKYVRYQRSLGMEVLFDTDSAFVSAMRGYGATLATQCMDNATLFKNPLEPIFRLSCSQMEKEGVEPFGP